MASTFTDLLRLEKQASGENDSTWGDRANTVFEMIEDAIANLKGVVMPADANYVLTTANSSTDEARCMGLSVTSGVPLTATRDVTCPTSTKSYLVKNLTTGGQSIRIKTAAGTGITIPNGKTSFVLCDGTNVISAIDWLSSLSLGTPLALADGGTSATSASAARTALGLVIGTDIEAHDADLTAIAGLGGTGIAVRTAANTWAQRQLVAPAAGISITNPDGVSGNPTFALANDLAAVEALSTTGLVARTGSETYSPRTLTGPAAGITVTNGGGVAGDPTLALANDLSALEGLGSTGFAVRTGADTWAQRSLTGTTGVNITNFDGVAGNPTLVLNNDLSALEGLGGTGIAVRTAADSWAQRTLAGTAGQIVVTNGDGVSGNPTVALSQDAGAILQNSRSADYTAVLGDANKHLYHPSSDNNPRTFTIDSNANVAYQIGTTLSFVNEINVLTIAITSDTLTLVGAGTTGSRTLAANGMATALKVAATKWVISGVGLS